MNAVDGQISIANSDIEKKKKKKKNTPHRVSKSGIDIESANMLQHSTRFVLVSLSLHPTVPTARANLQFVP